MAWPLETAIWIVLECLQACTASVYVEPVRRKAYHLQSIFVNQLLIIAMRMIKKSKRCACLSNVAIVSVKAR